MITFIFAYLIPISVEVMPHFYAERMMEHFQYLELPVFVSFVLEHLLDGYCLTSLCDHCFEHNSERAIANNLFSVVSQALLGLYRVG